VTDEDDNYERRIEDARRALPDILAENSSERFWARWQEEEAARQKAVDDIPLPVLPDDVRAAIIAWHKQRDRLRGCDAGNDHTACCITTLVGGS